MLNSSQQPQTDAQKANPPWVLFYHDHRRVFATPLDICLEIGRQRTGEPAPACRQDRSVSARIILAPLDDVDVSRSHIELKLLAPNQENATQIEVINLSRTQPIRLDSEQMLAPGEKTIAQVPLLLQFSSYAVRVEPPEEEELELQSLPERTLLPGQHDNGLAIESGLGRLNIDTMDEQLLLRWLETVLDVFQSAASAQDFPAQAAKALVKIVGLDAAAMLECDAEGRWKTSALYSATEGHNEHAWLPSQTLLAEVRKEKRTFRHVPSNVPDTAQSLQNVSALVSAPILNGEGEVIGALYGDRHSGGSSGSDSQIAVPDITLFEAKLVEVLASGIAAGLARVKEQKAAMAARVQLEQFVTPKIARQLQLDPQLLEGRDAMITVMFADIRGFSRISERLGPARTMDWMQDTMDVLSNCVLQCDGTLVDFVGDELMSMWGAPLSQADHAQLACRAAQEMLNALPEISQRWQKELGTPVELGIGMNSGIARVGNTGSRQRLKYGPLGDTVNVASRVQGATKYLGADCLFTASTLSALSSSPAKRRLARVQVINIEQPLDIFELVNSPGDDWETLQIRYEQALTTLESQNLTLARELVGRLAADFPEDRPTAALLRRLSSLEHTNEESTTDTSIWCLPGK